MNIETQINGESRSFEVDRSTLLLDLLRREGYTGAKRGCDTGACGFCTVLVDGEAEQSCVLPVTRVEDASIETIEGLGDQNDLHPVQEAFVDHSALQCGFCIPGMIMSAKGFLDDYGDVSPSDYEVREALEGNLCRCTGYKKPIEAVQDAADRMYGEPKGDEDGNGSGR